MSRRCDHHSAMHGTQCEDVGVYGLDPRGKEKGMKPWLGTRRYCKAHRHYDDVLLMEEPDGDLGDVVSDGLEDDQEQLRPSV